MSSWLRHIVLVVVVVTLVVLSAGAFLAMVVQDRGHYRVVPYPAGKTYAISLVDDADAGSVEQLEPVYHFLNSLKVKITKSIWMFPADGVPSGDLRYTIQLPEYKRFVLGIQERGHEIALHGVSAGNDRREDIIRGLDLFKETFGQYPTMHVDHSKNVENIYFGRHRVNSTLFRFFYALYDDRDYQGEDERSAYFWGDIARDKVKYHRGWYVTELNTLGINPSMPYHDPDHEYVRYWYSVTDGATLDRFLARLRAVNIQSLKDENGAAILYTHFGFGFYDETRNVLNAQFVDVMTRLADDEDIWMGPTSELLDRLLLFKNIRSTNEAGQLVISNFNDTDVVDVTVIALKANHEQSSLACRSGCRVRAVKPGVFVVDRLPPRSVTILAAVGNNPEVFVTDRLPPRSVTILAAVGDQNSRRSDVSLTENLRCFVAWLWRFVVIRQ